ncbi:hypothetical protein [Staphylococcus saprophyticus]|nr:hypothetical protein [Staphylococcus saprophyticus]MDW4486450.1 hypothetical protein [Staphylococcus saprophyticus]
MIDMLVNSQSTVPAYISLLYYHYDNGRSMTIRELMVMAEIENALSKLIK